MSGVNPVWCESCRRRLALVEVDLGAAQPFAVCQDCAPEAVGLSPLVADLEAQRRAWPRPVPDHTLRPMRPDEVRARLWAAVELEAARLGVDLYADRARPAMGGRS